MLSLEPCKHERGPLRILCLGAHADDIEIGCGGTILRLLDQYTPTIVHWVVFSANSERASEANRSAQMFLAAAQHKAITIKNFRESFFPYQAAEIKEYFEELKGLAFPHLIFTHYREDLHQDHRLISELTWNTFRDHFISEYEILKYDGDLGIPNFFVYLTAATCKKKIEVIINCFVSQRSKVWFSEETFRSLLRIRGVESQSPSAYAEAFHCRKIAFLQNPLASVPSQQEKVTP